MTTSITATSDARRRVGRAWRKMRRGASAIRIRGFFYGGDDALDLALADALLVVTQQGPLRMGELADALQITPASTTRAVSCLVNKGYVERVKAEDDQRSVLVSATRAGHNRADVMNAKIQHGLAEILAEFSADEQVLLADLLERFVRSLDRFGDAETGSNDPATSDGTRTGNDPGIGDRIGTGDGGG
jgi:DNA-binding MarR family transcriptional regulator